MGLFQNQPGSETAALDIYPISVFCYPLRVSRLSMTGVRYYHEPKNPATTHGHAPEKGPKPPFIVCGRAAKPGVRIPRAELIDEAPTILSIFDIPMPGADGKVLPLFA
jgi:hypothetical protein